MKVLYCVLDNRFGGPHRRAHATARQLRQHGVETVFLLGHKSGPVWNPQDFPALPLRHIQCFSRRRPLLNLLKFWLVLPLTLLRICRIIRSRRIDIVHVDGITNFAPAIAARLTRRPVVWLYNDHLPRPLQWFLLPLATTLAERVIVQGKALKDARTEGRPRLARKTCVIHTGLDAREFDPTRYDDQNTRRLREELNIPATSPLIGTIGNLNRFKGHDYFLQAAQQIKTEAPEAKFLIVGRKLETDTAYWEHLQQLTADLGLTDDVIFTGFQEDIPRTLSILDVFVLSSVLESCPCVLLEAMAMKAPVVTTDVGAASELVLEGQTGRVVPPRNASALAQAVLDTLAAAPEQTRETTEAARKRVEKEFGIDKIATQQRAIYESLGSRPATP